MLAVDDITGRLLLCSLLVRFRFLRVSSSLLSLQPPHQKASLGIFHNLEACLIPPFRLVCAVLFFLIK